MKNLLLCLLSLACLGILNAQWHIDENFDSLTGLPAGWTTYDDGDGMSWRNLNNASHAYSGTRAAFCDNYFPNQNADWLITPQLTIANGDSLKFYTRSWISTENLKVYVSTTGTAISNFGTLIVNLQNIGTTYQLASCNLSAYAGQNIYIGFLWNCVNYGILIDDIKIGQPLVITPELNLPPSFSFFQGDSLNVDFTPYIVCSDIGSASLSVAAPQSVSVSITGLMVHFSSPDWHGTEQLVFTLLDNLSSLAATDTVEVVVSPPPVFDLALTEIVSPNSVEYIGSEFQPQVRILNNGQDTWNDQLTFWFSLTNAQGSIVQTLSRVWGMPLQPQEAALVSFDPLSLNTAGNYTADFWMDVNDGDPNNDSLARSFEIVLRINIGGPDAFGYNFIDNTALGGPEFNWIDISSTGTSTIMYGVNSWGGDDNFSEPIPLSFDFPFYGSSYSTAYVDINGEILLAPNNWYDAYPGIGWDGDGNMFNYMHPIPGYTQMPALISVYWDDLQADQGTGDVYFQSFGSSPNRYTVIQWHNLRFHAGSNPASLLDFEVILHENGEIVMQYNSVATGQTGASIPHDFGKSSTVGIQNESAAMGLCYLREIVENNSYIGVEPAGNLLFDGLALRFYSGEDLQAPFIAHTPVGNSFNLSPVLNARVLDLSPLAAVNLQYNLGEGWNSTAGMPTGDGYYSFALPTLPAGNNLRYYFVASDALGNSGTLPANAPADAYQFKLLPSANTEVLVAYSGSQDYQRVELPLYEARLQALNINYDIYNWEEYVEYAIPDQYSTVLAYASVGSQSPKALYFSQVLMDYLDSASITNRKNLWFASDGWAHAQGGTPNSNQMKQLFNGYFRSSYVATGFGGGTNGLAGPETLNYHNGSILCLDNSPLGIPGTEYSVFANSPDCIFDNDAVPDWYADLVQYPEIGSSNAFAFEDGPVGGQAYLYHGVCATSVTTPIYRLFYLSFDLSQLNSATQNQALFADLMDWFEVQPSALADPGFLPGPTRLTGNYPNPFNPSTTIEFSLGKASRTDLSIYNLKGQKVKTLAQGDWAPGNHKIIWQGTDEQNQPVGSGIYFIRLNAGQYTETKKITLIK